jgi:pimeloyl-ACP methyl ester carboxylesterase
MNGFKKRFCVLLVNFLFLAVSGCVRSGDIPVNVEENKTIEDEQNELLSRNESTISQVNETVDVGAEEERRVIKVSRHKDSGSSHDDTSLETEDENTLPDDSNSSDNFSSIVGTPVKYASVNGITIGYREFGSGEPLLMILPFSATMDMCNDTFIGKLADSYRVILFDNRGVGYSSDNNETSSISLFANDTTGLMDALGLPSAHIFGSSMGAAIAQELTLGHADKVDRLILSSATYSLDIPQTEILKNRLQSVASNPDADPVLRKYAEANLEWNGTYERLPEIQKRTLLLVGTEEVLTPVNVSVIIAEQIPDAQLVRFEGVGHSGEQYVPEEYANEILDFLASE